MHIFAVANEYLCNTIYDWVHRAREVDTGVDFMVNRWLIVLVDVNRVHEKKAAEYDE